MSGFNATQQRIAEVQCVHCSLAAVIRQSISGHFGLADAEQLYRFGLDRCSLGNALIFERPQRLSDLRKEF